MKPLILQTKYVKGENWGKTFEKDIRFQFSLAWATLFIEYIKYDATLLKLNKISFCFFQSSLLKTFLLVLFYCNFCTKKQQCKNDLTEIGRFTSTWGTLFCSTIKTIRIQKFVLWNTLTLQDKFLIITISIIHF
jgi:hypothetical protein